MIILLVFRCKSNAFFLNGQEFYHIYDYQVYDKSVFRKEMPSVIACLWCKDTKLLRPHSKIHSILSPDANKQRPFMVITSKRSTFAALYFQSRNKLFCKEGYLISPPVGLIVDLEFQPSPTETPKRHLWITRNQHLNAYSRTTIRTCIAWHSLW